MIHMDWSVWCHSPVVGRVNVFLDLEQRVLNRLELERLRVVLGERLQQ